ncbi:MAG: Hsp20/alpha crystallin family protein [Prevotella sp.]|jgi:HSP20 family molecular chaperone IbpA
MITINFLRPFSSMMDFMLNDVDLLPHFEEIPTNLKESDDSYVMEMAIPGMKRSNVSLKVKNGMLRLLIHKGHRFHWPWQRNRVYIRCERKLPLPDSVDVNKIKAKVCDGVLTITFPKKESYVTIDSNPRIQIQIA